MPTVIEQKQFYTRKQLCDRYQVSDRTIRNWEYRKLLSPVWIGGVLRYPACQVHALDVGHAGEQNEGAVAVATA